jgi:hypothetical protein
MCRERLPQTIRADYPGRKGARQHFVGVAWFPTILSTTMAGNDTGNSGRLRDRLPFAGPGGPRPAAVLFHHLPLPLSSSSAAGQLVGTHVPPVDRLSHRPLAQRCPERPGTPSEPATDRYFPRPPHGRSAASRAPALVTSQKGHALRGVQAVPLPGWPSLVSLVPKLRLGIRSGNSVSGVRASTGGVSGTRTRNRVSPPCVPKRSLGTS